MQLAQRNERSSTFVARFSGKKFWTDFKFLFLEQLIRYRVVLPYTLTMAFVFPIVLIFGFARIGGGVLDNKAGLIYIIAGSSVFAMVQEGIHNLSQRVSFMRSENRFLYYASLPISKIAFVMALLFSRILVVGLPGMLTPIIYGVVFHNLTLNLTFFWLILLIPLASLTFAALGAFLGLSITNSEVVATLVNLLTLLLLLVSSLYIPLANLPLPLQIFSFLLPPSYAADALRHVLANTIGWEFYFDMAVLSFVAVGSLVGLQKYLRWRID